MWNGVALTNSSHNRHWPVADPPATSPTTVLTASSTHFLYGAMPIRYRSRFCCSGDIALSGGRSRCARNMFAPTASPISSPKAQNSAIFVHNTVPNTEE